MEEIEIHINGQIDRNWSDWLGGLVINYSSHGHSVLTGSVRDQSALVGLLNSLSGLGLQIVSMASRETDAPRPQGGSKTCER